MASSRRNQQLSPPLTGIDTGQRDGIILEGFNGGRHAVEPGQAEASALIIASSDPQKRGGQKNSPNYTPIIISHFAHAEAPHNWE